MSKRNVDGGSEETKKRRWPGDNYPGNRHEQGAAGKEVDGER
jgi:hypothetical protein